MAYAPSITFWTGSNTGSFGGAFATSSWGQMLTVFDYGTINTGSTGSTVYFWIYNNATGSQNIASAILSASAQYTGYPTGSWNQLGLGHHESGSVSHTTEGSYAWSLQSGSLTGSVWVSSSYFYSTALGFSGSSGSGPVSSSWCSQGYIYIFSGSYGNRLTANGLVLSGSISGTTTGSGWLIASYLNILTGIPQGGKTGSFCVAYQYT
jgi:hypothetical protein